MNKHSFAQCSSALLRRAMLALCLVQGLGLFAIAQKLQISTFDVPGADNGTLSIDIAPDGKIAGYYFDGNNVMHGFLRNPDGTISTFDAPGAGTRPGEGTLVHAISPDGTIVGSYLGSTTFYAYVRTPGGNFTTFAAPGACTDNINDGCHGTGAWNINSVGTVVGVYEDTSGNFVAHTYIRTSDENFTTFEAPGSSMQAGQGTLPGTPRGVNDFGAITGYYYDTNNNFHGFLRSPDGNFEEFEAPGADQVDPFYGTNPVGINDSATITGLYLDANGVFHGFLRRSNRKFISFDAPGADLNPGDFNGTFPSAINLFGAITGSYIDVNGVSHGFMRSPGDKFTTFDAPGAGVDAGQGTAPISNNLFGAITGYYADANYAIHGFVAIPCEERCDGMQVTEKVVFLSPKSNAKSHAPIDQRLIRAVGAQHHVTGSLVREPGTAER